MELEDEQKRSPFKRIVFKMLLHLHTGVSNTKNFSLIHGTALESWKKGLNLHLQNSCNQNQSIPATPLCYCKY